MITETLSIYSDVYKDAYGIRPRHDMSHLSEEELNQEIDRLNQIAEDNADEEEEIAQFCVNSFKDRLQTIINVGANDEETAIRWMFQGSNTDDFEHYIWSEGILFTDYGRNLVNQYQNI